MNLNKYLDNIVHEINNEICSVDDLYELDIIDYDEFVSRRRSLLIQLNFFDTLSKFEWETIKSKKRKN